ncbi:unnamed protein product [Diabrotica balteata]|uniref:Uncharacterized protein n=1 Tax=Diabrotica balteata TaxID=107213 RepID=A0A9N9XAP2_DIABA|nr:unnamed protein product [Diabrotica balteata]
MNKTIIFVTLVLLSFSCVKSDDNINRFRDLQRQPRIFNSALLNTQNYVNSVFNLGCTIVNFFVNTIISVQRFIVNTLITLLTSFRGILFTAFFDFLINIVNAIDTTVASIFQGVSTLGCGTTTGIASFINTIIGFIINI